ncbi:SMI1/KNR4 family protein [Desulfobaculum sp. SPO524]|uniref:SMI1/KNR4 family protein n=1 Tax=Desulfobaculum sp. SPO524 TaxID=3378071 RepID=UPI0038537B29
MQYYEKFLELLKTVPAERQDWYGGATEEQIVAFEEKVGHRFPPTYRRFLKEFGEGDVYAMEFEGITSTGELPLATLEVLEQCAKEKIPPVLIVNELGDGTFWGIYFSEEKNGEFPIYGWHGTLDYEWEYDASSFGEFIYTRLAERIEYKAREAAGETEERVSFSSWSQQF